MKLSDYDHPPGIRGLHSCAAFDKPVRDREKWADEYVALGMNWAKLLDDGHGSNFAFAKMLKDRGVMPIVRFWIGSGQFLPDYTFATAERYISEGITRWFEWPNEPNIDEAGATPGSVLRTWLPDAKRIIELGGYPGFPPMAACGRHDGIGPSGFRLGSIIWYEWLFAMMKDGWEEEARHIFSNGAWLSVHDAVLNHCYEDDGGWHFECPYDEITQKDKPTTGIFDGDNSLLGHLVPVVLLKKHFGLTVPVISTEGGVFVKPGWYQEDARYPGYDYQGQAERTVAMYRWLERYQATFPWYFGMCPWLMANSKMGHQQPAWREDGWYHDVHGKLPVVQAVKDMGGPMKNPQPFDYQKWPGWDLGDQLEWSYDQGDGSMDVWKNVPPQITQWKPLIEKATSSYHVPIDDYKGKHISPARAMAVIIMVESEGKQYAKNPESGAAGLCQIMPMHFEPGQDPYDPEWNIRKGLSILNWALNESIKDGYGRHIQHGLFRYSGKATRPWEGFINRYWTHQGPPGFIERYKEFWGVDLEPNTLPPINDLQEALKHIGKAKNTLKTGYELAMRELDEAEEHIIGA